MNDAIGVAVRVGRFGRALSSRNPELLAAAILLLLIGLPVLLGPWFLSSDPLSQELAARLQPPSRAHWFGTDGLGRDVGARLLYGGRATLGLVAGVASLMIPLGVGIGIVAGYFGGWVDWALTGLTNLVMAFPPLVFALALVGVLGPGLVNCALALILTGWPVYARLARAQTLILRRSDYLSAARMQGIQGARLLWGHVLPACIPTIQTRAGLDFASIILSAAAFGFLGLGVRPPTPEWGMMIAEGSRVIFHQWWVAAFPGAAVLIASLAFNLAADGLRELAVGHDG